MKNGMMMSCKEATEMVIRKSEEKLSMGNQLRLMVHLAMCKFCSMFEKQNKIIDAMATELDDKFPEKMPESAKQKILHEISK